ncbi:MAG: hypothetical protein ACRDK3_17345 [Actinomycetota bacterium]
MWASQRGQSSAEYLGILAFVVGLILVVLLAAPGVGGTLVDRIVCIITGGECGGDEPVATLPEDFTPDSCQVSSRETVDRGSVKIAFVHLGGDYYFARNQNADGTTELTFVDLGEIGAELGAGGQLEITSGAKTYGGKLKGDIGGKYGLSSGDTWSFASPEEADEFESWITREKSEDRISQINPAFGVINWAVEEITGEEDLPDPRITFTEHGGSVAAEAGGSIGIGNVGVEGSASVMIGSSHDRGDDRDSEHDDLYSDYYQVDFELAGEAGILVAGAGGGWTGQGVVKITRDASGEAISLEIVDTSEGSFSGLADIDAERLTWQMFQEELQDNLSVTGEDASTSSIVATTAVDLDTPEKRATAEDWFGALNGLTTAGERAVDGDLVSGQDQAVDDFNQMLFDDARVSVVEYDGRKSGLEVAAEIALALKLGANFGTSETEADAVEAFYLGAPDDGQRTLVPFTECVAGTP